LGVICHYLGMKYFTTIFILCTIALNTEFNNSAFASPNDAGFEDSSDLPASWEVTEKKGYKDQTKKRLKRRKKKSIRPWYKPRFALGGGLNIPEFVPLSGYMIFGKYFALRGFYAPPMPFKIRVEMPSDVISTKKKIGVANPDFTIRFKAIYGPHYGLEGMVFPFGGSFFVGGGASFRQIDLTGETKSPLYVCSLIEAAKDPPCNDPDKRLTTSTEIELSAEARTTAILARGSAGWMWHMGRVGFFTLYGGYTKPVKVKRYVEVTADLDTPASADEDLKGALSEVRVEKEAELREKAMTEITPTTERPIPILGIGIGFRF
jgi:hypothetical protein